MSDQSASGFLTGFAAGAASAALGGMTLLYGAARTDWIDTPVPQWFSWVDRNLGLSLLVFFAVAVTFQLTLSELGRRVRANDSPDRIAQMDYLSDIWISLFFGTGVIWTAIGMRNALLFALGDPVATVDAGAMAMLERMVDGGILVALSTTIFGGVGGYLMRVVKTVSVGADLRRRYAQHGRADAMAIRASLEQMNERLSALRGAGSE